jgi:corrinoid protein of di/trimethylamine methyltransferase
MEDLERLYDAVLAGNAKLAAAVTREAVEAGTDPQMLLDEYMIPAMDEVGRRFEANECFVPELLISARAMKGAVEIIRPLLATAGAEPVGRVVIGTVQGDLHDIGKNLVAIMLEGGGFEITDVGVDANPDKFLDAINTKKPDIVALSALLTTTLPSMKNIIDRMNQAGVRSQVKVIVGGAPVTQDFADEIGADGYSDNAGAAVSLARRLLGLN